MSLRHRARVAPAYAQPDLFNYHDTRTHLPPRPQSQRIALGGAQSPRIPPPRTHWLDFDGAALCVVTALAFATRFFRLEQPKSIVFDELHFMHFLENHLQNKFSFDIHPWLGKLTLAAAAKLAGYRAGLLPSFDIGTPYPNADYMAPRIASALFGALCVPLLYLLPRELGLSRAACVLCATLSLCDTLLLTQSRFALLDSQLMFYLALTLLLALRLFREAERLADTKAVRAPPRYYAALLGTAAAAAAAVSVKWTAGVTPLLVAAACATTGAPFMTRRLPAPHCALAGALALALYVLPWYAHVAVSTQSTAMATRMGDQFRATLHGNATLPYDPAHGMSFARKLLHLHVRQFNANRRIKTRHKWETRWYEWPLNQRGILYSAVQGPNVTAPGKDGGAPREQFSVHVVYLLQNAAGALVVSAGVLASVAWLCMPTRRRATSGAKHGALGALSGGGGGSPGASAGGGGGSSGSGGGALRRRRSVTFADGRAPSSSAAHMRAVLRFLLAGYALNLAPYLFVRRCYFVYHYLPALMYGQLITAVMVDRLPRGAARIGTTVCVCGLVVAAFVYWSPWVYALRISVPTLLRMRWMARWD